MSEKTENVITEELPIPEEMIKNGVDNGIPIEVKPDNTLKQSSNTPPHIEKRKRKYTDWKGKYFTSRGWNLIMIVFLFFMGLLLASTLRGNHVLQMELNKIVQGG